MSTKEKFFTERDKTMGKLFFLVFVLSFLVLNWSDVSWFLNLNTAPYLIREKIQSISLFDREKEDKPEKEENGEEDVDLALYCQDDKITLPSIDISVPVVEAGGTTPEEYKDALERGVLHFPGTSYPGERGMTVLLGHSAPLDYPEIDYVWVFSKISQLEEGDRIEVCFNNKLTVYTVIDEERGKKVYEVGEDVPSLYPIEEEKKEVVLMSCWPPGDNTNRIGVRGVVKD